MISCREIVLVKYGEVFARRYELSLGSCYLCLMNTLYMWIFFSTTLAPRPTCPHWLLLTWFHCLFSPQPTGFFLKGFRYLIPWAFHNWLL